MFFRWLVLGLLACPTEIVTAGLQDSLELVLSNAVRFPVFRDVSVPIVELFDETLARWPFDKDRKTGKPPSFKRMVADCRQYATDIAPTQHSMRRAYFRQEVRRTLQIARYRPGMIAPKWDSIRALATVVWSEIRWFFHENRSATAAGREAVSTDPELGYLIASIIGLCDFVRRNSAIVGEYYREFLRGRDLYVLHHILSHAYAADASL